MRIRRPLSRLAAGLLSGPLSATFSASVRTVFAAGLTLAATAAAAIPFDLQIYDRTENRYLPTYQFQGRTYVVGRPGNEYSVSLRNQSGERVLAVASVDGVNIVSGETASPSQTGYVLSPGQSADIKGWRKSLSQTAAFYFTEHDNSYAARTGRPNDVGVIGVAVFRERRAPPPPIVPYSPSPRPWKDRDDSSGGARPYGSEAPQQGRAAESSADARSDSPMAQSQPSEMYRREKSLGTGHGRQEYSQTRYTDFQRASASPEQVVTIYYDTYSNLLAMGVPVWRNARDDDYAWRKPQPRPFPRDPTYGFVPDPR
jgi:hypothetical protein